MCVCSCEMGLGETSGVPCPFGLMETEVGATWPRSLEGSK